MVAYIEIFSLRDSLGYATGFSDRNSSLNIDYTFEEFVNLGMPRVTRGTRCPKVPGRFSLPRSPLIRIQHPVPATIPRVPPKSNYFDNFLHFLNLFQKKMRAPHYIWLFLILILSIPHYFVISNHIILLISKTNQNKFQINFRS